MQWHTRGRLALLDPSWRRTVLVTMRQAARHARVALLAFCILPDEVELLVEPVELDGDVDRFVRLVRHRTSYLYRVRLRRPLWAPEHVVSPILGDRASHETRRRILERPVQRGLARHADGYDASGSDRHVRLRAAHTVPVLRRQIGR